MGLPSRQDWESSPFCASSFQRKSSLILTLGVMGSAKASSRHSYGGRPRMCLVAGALSTPSFHDRPCFQASRGLQPGCPSVRLFSLGSVVNRDHSSLLDEGKRDADGFQPSDNTMTVCRGGLFYSQMQIPSIFTLREEMKVHFEDVKLDYSVMCKCANTTFLHER